MSNVYVIADTHFNHSGILNFPPRKGLFSSIEEHDQTLIDNWNSVVTKKDIVYHLGDVGWEKGQYLSKGVLPFLNGRKFLIAGNHDEPAINACFEKVMGAKTVKGNILTHIPIHPQEMFWSINIHGHLHSNRVWKYANDPMMGKMGNEADPRYLCVSVEHTGYKPVNLHELIKSHMEKYGKIINSYPRPPSRN